MLHNVQVLEKVISDCKIKVGNGIVPLCVFDLDSTLFDVQPRILKVLHDFAQSYKETNEETAALISKIQSLPKLYHFRDIISHFEIEKFGEQVVLDATSYLNWHFFSDKYLQYDMPYPGAASFVSYIHNLGAKILYLTGRDKQRMEKGTVESLLKHGFPIEKTSLSLADSEKLSRYLKREINAGLAMKPDKEIPDSDYKTNFFDKPEIAKNTWFFENEPENIIKISKTSRQMNIVYFDSVHSGTSEIPKGFPLTINSFVRQSNFKK